MGDADERAYLSGVTWFSRARIIPSCRSGINQTRGISNFGAPLPRQRTAAGSGTPWQACRPAAQVGKLWGIEVPIDCRHLEPAERDSQRPTADHGDLCNSNELSPPRGDAFWEHDLLSDRPGQPPRDDDPAATPPQPPESRRVISLDDYLKTGGFVGTGGQAKLMIQSGDVSVNGQVETRRRRKLLPGDVVELLGQRIVVQEDIPQR